MLPGRELAFVDAGTPRSAVGSQSGQGFMVGEADRGPAIPTLITSLAKFIATFGGRVSYSVLYDAVDTAFQEGVRQVWISRVIGTAAVKALAALSDGSATTFSVRAKGTGAYGNNLKVIVLTSVDRAAIPVGSYVLQITETVNAITSVIEESPILATKGDALVWMLNVAQTVEYVDGAGTNAPVRVASPGTALATGADDRPSIADAHWQTALDRFTYDLGAGQVAMPGRATTPAYLALLDHGRLRNRHALLDLADTPTISTLTGAAAAAAAAPNLGGRFGSAYWPWAKVPAVQGSSFGTRVVPWSAVQMGLFASVDRLGNPNQAAAGELFGTSRYAVGLSQDTASLLDVDATTLNDAGVNIGRLFYGARGPAEYGNRTLRSTSADPLWAQASGSRLAMVVAARGDTVIRRFVHRQVDAKGLALGQLRGELAADLATLYEKGAVYGATASEAFSVDTGDQVNPPEQVATGLIRAVLKYRTSPSADRVRLELVRVPITESV